MKKKLFKILPLLGLLLSVVVACKGPEIEIDGTNDSATNTTESSVETTLEPIESSTIVESTTIEPSSTASSTSISTETNKVETQTINPIPIETSTTAIETTTTNNVEKYTLSEIKALGEALEEGQTGIEVAFDATYVKKITDNNDHLFLFVDDTDYLCMRHVGKLTDYLDNRYCFCDYKVTGYVSKQNGNVEVLYESLENITSEKQSFDFSNLTLNCASIEDVYKEVEKVQLNNKYNGVGSIVTFSGAVLATDRDNSNSKAVFYDNKLLITVINWDEKRNQKICDGVNDILNQFEVTGIISILKGQPAILLLDLKSEDKTITIDYSNAQAVVPSYFSTWYHVSDKIKDPSYADFAKLYKITGYVNTDESRNAPPFYFGLTDAVDGKLSDTGIKTSIKGVYMMNYQNQKTLGSLNEAVYNAYQDEANIEVYASLYQFDTQNHAWKVFIVDQTLKAVE